MNTTRFCGCKGYRSCKLCEDEFGIASQEVGQERADQFERTAVFCLACQNAFMGDRCSAADSAAAGRLCSSHQGRAKFEISGVEIIENFVSATEELQLVADLDKLEWDTSQSGRRKQNFGPRANFKKRKVKAGQKFCGFPQTTEFVQRRFDQVPLLRGYQTVEQCSIEYRPETGARIDPHIDDCWVWGERIVQLNMLSDSVLTLLPYTDKRNGDRTKYNLQDVPTFPKVVRGDSQEEDSGDTPYAFKESIDMDVLVRLPLPRRSLLIMHGEARYQWEHCILRSDISDRRVIIAYRELTPPYLPGGTDWHSVGQEIVEKAKCFW